MGHLWLFTLPGRASLTQTLYQLVVIYFLDFTIVITTTVDFLVPLIMQNVSSFDVAAIFRLLKLFRSIKALRALRVLRTVRYRIADISRIK